MEQLRNERRHLMWDSAVVTAIYLILDLKILSVKCLTVLTGIRSCASLYVK